MAVRAVAERVHASAPGAATNVPLAEEASWTGPVRLRPLCRCGPAKSGFHVGQPDRRCCPAGYGGVCFGFPPEDVGPIERDTQTVFSDQMTDWLAEGFG